MELQTAAVSHRIGELRRLARSLRLERRRPRHRPLAGLRIALGRRLVALGGLLLDGARARPTNAIR